MCCNYFVANVKMTLFLIVDIYSYNCMEYLAPKVLTDIFIKYPQNGQIILLMVARFYSYLFCCDFIVWVLSENKLGIVNKF